MATILVVDDMAVFRDPMAAMLKLAGHSTLTAANGEEALDILGRERVDLVLLDLAMPVMDGITFLERRRTRPQAARIPIILLTAVTDRGRIVEAVKHGVRECLLKSQFSSKDLLGRVQRLLETAPPPEANAPKQSSAAAAAGSPDAGPRTPAAAQPAAAGADALVPRVLTREQSLARVEESMELTTLSGVAAEIVSLAASPHSDVSSLASMISRDAVLAARVLRVANSAGYVSRGGAVVDINDAVKRIGLSTVRNIAASVGIYDSMPSSAAGAEREFMRCWQHSLAVANLCEQLTAQSQTPDESGVAYLIGLCHDLAEVLLRGHFQSEYAQVLECERRTGASRDLLERQMLGVTHHDLTTLIVGRIGLPEKIRGPIQAFHDPAGGGRAGDAHMTKVLKLADAYANGLMLGAQRSSKLSVFTRAECKSALGVENPTTPEADQVRGDILAQTLMLARLSRAVERELTAPAFPRAKTRVLLIRDPALSAFDPFTTFVQAVADARVQERPATVAELAQVDRVIVLSKGTANAVLSVEELTKLAALKPCLWAVSKIDSAVPADGPVQPRKCPLEAEDVAVFVSGEASRVDKAAA